MSDLYWETAYMFYILEWVWAIFINVLLVYLSYKFVTWGIGGGVQRLFKRKKKKSDINSGAKYG